MDKNNKIGDIGERIFNLTISRGYRFQPSFLGEKWPNSDYFIEILGHSKPYYFVVQVKATGQGINRNNKLKISVSKNKLQELNKYPCPTYLVGVDTQTEVSYIIPVNKNKRKGLSGMPIGLTLNEKTKDMLYKDVIDFWENSKVNNYKNKHKHNLR